jgi:hypothetical protein
MGQQRTSNRDAVFEFRSKTMNISPDGSGPGSASFERLARRVGIFLAILLLVLTAAEMAKTYRRDESTQKAAPILDTPGHEP